MNIQVLVRQLGDGAQTKIKSFDNVKYVTVEKHGELEVTDRSGMQMHTFAKDRWLEYWRVG